MEYMDGGSLDLIMKKMGRIHEPYTRKITHAVSQIGHTFSKYLFTKDLFMFLGTIFWDVILG